MKNQISQNLKAKRYKLFFVKFFKHSELEWIGFVIAPASVPHQIQFKAPSPTKILGSGSRSPSLLVSISQQQAPQKIKQAAS